MSSNSPSPRQPTNVTLPAALLAEARGLDINLSQACEVGLAAAVAQARQEVWLRQNREAIEAWNQHVGTSPLPLADFQTF